MYLARCASLSNTFGHFVRSIAYYVPKKMANSCLPIEVYQSSSRSHHHLPSALNIIEERDYGQSVLGMQR